MCHNGVTVVMGTNICIHFNTNVIVDTTPEKAATALLKVLTG